MKIHTTMPTKLVPFYEMELINYKAAFQDKDYQKSWYHLERAHILGQAYPIEHTLVHWKMLLFGIHIKNAKEIVGQIPRLLIGGVKSFVGEIPIGNTGGANVPPLQPMIIPKDLEEIINKSKTK